MFSKEEKTGLENTFAIPPMRTGGTAIMMQPKAARQEISSAVAADLLESTRWKYTFFVQNVIR